MKVRVSVKEKCFDIQVGPGIQTLHWLANTAIARYDPNFSMDLGVPVAIRTEDGSTLPFTQLIREKISDGDLVVILMSKEAGDAEEKFRANEEEGNNEMENETNEGNEAEK